MSNSLPGLARFGCDLSATVGGIPNFGQTSQNRGSDHYDTERSEAVRHALVIAAAPGQGNGLACRPAWALFINQSGSLGLSTSSIPTCGDGRWGTRRRMECGEPRFKSLAGGRCPRMGMRTPILNASLCGALATVGRGRSGKQIRYLRLSGNLLLGCFGPPTMP